MGLTNGKFLLGSSVNGAAIRLVNNQYLRARNNADSADIDILRVNTSDDIEFLTIPEVLGMGALALNSSIVTLQSNRALTTLANLGVTAINSDFTWNKGAGVAVNLIGKSTVATEASGVFTINSGDVSGVATNSGNMVLKSGTATDGNTGNVTFGSGNAALGNSGNVTISTGTAGATRGTMFLSALDIEMDTQLTFTGGTGIDMGAGLRPIINLQDPTNAQDAATKAYVLANAGSASFEKDQYTVVAPIVVNTNVVLSQTPKANSVLAYVTTGPILIEGVDYTLAVATITLLAASPVIALLAASDVIEFQFSY